MAFSNLYNLTKVKAANIDDYWYKSATMEETEGISRCTSCREGYTFVVTGKQNMANIPCSSADGPSIDAMGRDPNLKADDCRASDPLLTLSTGVCVRAFNDKGRNAIKALRKEVKRAYASSFVGEPDVASGHTDEGSGEAYPDAVVSLDRLETLWVASSYLLICCFMISVATCSLCLYSVRSSFYVQRFFSQKVFKTADDASAVDWLKLFSIVLLSTWILLDQSITIQNGSTRRQFEGPDGVEDGRRSLYCNKEDFKNTLQAEEGDFFLSQSTNLMVQGDRQPTWKLNYAFFRSNTMLFTCDEAFDFMKDNSGELTESRTFWSVIGDWKRLLTYFSLALSLSRSLGFFSF